MNNLQKDIIAKVLRNKGVCYNKFDGDCATICPINPYLMTYRYCGWNEAFNIAKHLCSEEEELRILLIEELI